MKRIFSCFSLMLLFNFSSAQYWMQRGGGTTIDEGMDIACDGANNTYTTGYFTTTATFDNNTTLTSVGLNDIFIVKTAGGGALQWVKRAGGLNVDKALAIDADSSGNFVITGFYYAAATFDTQTITAAGLQDAFVAKYDASGNLLWVKSIGGAGSESGNGITIDDVGNVIVTGEFSGTCSFDATTLTSLAGSIDVFTAKYDSNGNLLWAKKGSGKYTDRGNDVSTDAGGNIYVSGMFSDTITFDLQHNNPMYNAMFLLKYDASGAEQWFRWMGSGTAVNMAGVKVFNNDVNITGNFSGTLYFFGLPGNPTLTGTFTNDIFVCRFDLLGNLVWSHADGSVNEITAQAIGTNSTGEVIVAGNFKCRLSDFSAQYGSGIFCSIGYWDNFVASYDNTGNWMWARHFGGRQNDYLHGLTVKASNKIIVTGSYEDGILTTYDQGNCTFYGNTNDYSYPGGSISTYCADNNYNKYSKCNSYGNSDIIINANIDLNREPYDYFQRIGTICTRPFNDICIGASNSNLLCQDTLFNCGTDYLSTDKNIATGIGPNFNYLWSDGSSGTSLYVTTSGYYHVSVTTEDGCFANRDTIYFASWPIPPTPLISDSKGVNTNALNTQPISICLPDSVVLNCTNVGANNVKWSNYPQGQNPVKTYSGGYYNCTLTNQYGCVNSNNVQIIAGAALAVVQPKMRCLEDTDNNDTIEVCFGDDFSMFLYDELSNPGGLNLNCFPNMTYATWMAGAGVTYNPLSYCNSFSLNWFQPLAVGSFNITISSWIIRSNPCDTDSVFCLKSLHVIVHPTPVGSLFIAVTGPSYMCPGDTVMLIAAPDSLYFTWSNGQQNDTIYVTQPGIYSVSASMNITNSFGCGATITGYANINLSGYPQPNVTMIPVNGLICPNDSVQLICSGTGSFNWQGPNGNTGANQNNTYVNTPGFYYCIQTVAPGCDLVSNTVTVIQYNIPLIIAFPGQAICSGNPVTLTVVTNPGSMIQWQAPLSGSSTSQVVLAAGTYNCIVTSCGIVTPLSFTVYHDSAFAQITSPGSLTFCNGDSVLLTANSGMAGYEWLPGGDTTLNIYVTQQGIYSLVVTSPFGCHDTASITVTEIPNLLTPPLISDTTICPGDSIIISASSADTIYWCSTPAYNTVFNMGSAYQTPSLTNGVTYYLYTAAGQCKSDFDSVQISIFPQPALTMNSVNGLICPNDSIQLICSGSGSFNWLGPNGSVGSNNDTIFVNVPGFYYCIQTASPGCNLVSDTVQLIPYNTPSVSAFPGQAICSGVPVTLHVVTNIGSNIQWQSPLTGSSSSQVVNMAGTYNCNVTSCDIITPLTFTVYYDSALAQINSPGLLSFCSGDSVLLTSNSGMASYAWFPTGDTTSSIYAKQPGNYSLVTTSQYGCHDTADIVVTEVLNVLSPPHIPDSMICSGDSLILFALVTDTVHWSYTPDYNNIFFTGWTYHTPGLANPVTYYLFTEAGQCRSGFDSVNITIDEGCYSLIIPNIFTPNDDGLNDYFPAYSGYYLLDLTIYNRWGKVIYEGKRKSTGWDGRASNGEWVADGTYYYVLSTEFFNRTKSTYRGFVMLIRE